MTPWYDQVYLIFSRLRFCSINYLNHHHHTPILSLSLSDDNYYWQITLERYLVRGATIHDMSVRNQFKRGSNISVHNNDRGKMSLLLTPDWTISVLKLCFKRELILQYYGSGEGRKSLKTKYSFNIVTKKNYRVLGLWLFLLLFLIFITLRMDNLWHELECVWTDMYLLLCIIRVKFLLFCLRFYKIHWTGSRKVDWSFTVQPQVYVSTTKVTGFRRVSEKVKKGVTKESLSRVRLLVTN